jgi:uncharacterized protein YqhQ
LQIQINASHQIGTSKKIDFAVGGQAVVEGVMMRSPNTIVISVRKQDKSIKVKDKFYRTLTQKYKILNIPILRGVINLFEMMAVGVQAINFSANEFVEQEDQKLKTDPKNPSERDSRESEKPGSKPSKAHEAKSLQTKISKPIAQEQKSLPSRIFEFSTLIFSIVIAIAISIALFKFLPLWITTFLETKSIFIKNNYIIFNLIDGIIKTTFFVLYIYMLSVIPSFKRIFEYHGAEHKAVFTYESSLPLTVENAKKQSRFHPRCGTSFILIVFLISILVYTFVPRQPEFWANLSLRLVMLPFIAGISYEYLKISARYATKGWSRALVAPGLWLQRLTTKEPSSDQLEVALNSLKIALKKEAEL